MHSTKSDHQELDAGSQLVNWFSGRVITPLLSRRAEFDIGHTIPQLIKHASFSVHRHSQKTSDVALIIKPVKIRNLTKTALEVRMKGGNMLIR